MVTQAQGEFEAHEVLKRCVRGDPCPVVGSEELRRLVPPRQRYGYDLIVHVGLARYLRGRQRKESRTELRDVFGIDLSDGTISNLCDRFLVALERLHLHRAPALRDAMEGGYPLHLDATCEQGRGGLFVALDGWRGWVLAAKRIPSEKREHLESLVEQAVALFGDPVAVVRDLSEAIGVTVEPLRQRGVSDLACHYHFLAAVGKKLLDRPYGLLRTALGRCRVRSLLLTHLRELRRSRRNDGHEGESGRGLVREELLALILWLLEGDGHKDAPFPFSLPHLHFVRRCGRAAEHPARRDQDGRVLAVVARTNNVIEHLFGGHKQDLRRRLGRAHLARDLQQQPAQAALVTNLRHPEYVRVLCGSLDNLPAAFAALDGVAIAVSTPLVRDHKDHRLHRHIKRLLENSGAITQHDNTDSQDDVPSKAPPHLSSHLSDLDGLTEEQLRARCATVFGSNRDPRLPPIGGVLTRVWQGVEHQVRILDRGFEYQGQTYTSLTAIARSITDGRKDSGVSFFYLHRLRIRNEPPANPRPAEPTYPLGPPPAWAGIEGATRAPTTVS